MAVKKRCGFCVKKLRADGTCQNPNCPRFVPEPEPTETPATNESEQSSGESAADTNNASNTETPTEP